MKKWKACEIEEPCNTLLKIINRPKKIPNGSKVLQIQYSIPIANDQQLTRTFKENINVDPFSYTSFLATDITTLKVSIY